MGEIDLLLDGRGVDQEDTLPEIEHGATPVTQKGDLWILGERRLLCGDALQAETYAHLLGTDKVQMLFADPPFNVPIAGNVSLGPAGLSTWPGLMRVAPAARASLFTAI